MFRYTCLVFLLRFAPQPFLTSTSAQCGEFPPLTPGSTAVVQQPAGKPACYSGNMCYTGSRVKR